MKQIAHDLWVYRRPGRTRPRAQVERLDQLQHDGQHDRSDCVGHDDAAEPPRQAQHPEAQNVLAAGCAPESQQSDAHRQPGAVHHGGHEEHANHEEHRWVAEQGKRFGGGHRAQRGQERITGWTPEWC